MMVAPHFVFRLLLVVMAGATALAQSAPVLINPSTGKPYDVLLIMIDDHKPDLHSAPGGNRTVATPSMERLAARSTWFTRAYVDAPACCPSRTALVTGVSATRSGVYYNNQAYRRTKSWISGVQTLPGLFKERGYFTAHFGKITHNRYLEDDERDYAPGYYKAFNRNATHKDSELRRFILPGTEVTMWTAGWSWGVLPDEWDRDDPSKRQQDTEFALQAAQLLKQKHDRPFFIACGFWRPHVSWTVPKRYFDRYPLDSIELPESYRADDNEDLPKAAQWLATHRGEHAFITQNGLWKKCLQAKYAATAYVDDQIGRLLDALDSGPNRDNTIIVFAADNGWHTGEKEHWSKFYLSELACRVVFSVSVPGLPPQRYDHPVGLIDIYPTLASLCGLGKPQTHDWDGVDLTPLLRDPQAQRGRPVLSTYGPDCHSLRDDHFRYTRYLNGEEELYDHRSDPYEWRNLDSDTRYAADKARLRAALPPPSAPEIEYTTGKEKDSNAWSDRAFD